MSLTEQTLDFFSQDGILSHYLKNYQPRYGQVSMAVAVSATLEQNKHLIVEAGTGTGKCLSQSSMINFESGSRLSIKQLIDKKHLPCEKSTSLVNNKIVYQKVLDIINNGIKPIFEIKTALGKSIKATGNHPLLTLNGWVNVDFLKKGDHIAVARRLPESKENYYKDISFLVGCMLGDGGMTNSQAPTFTNFDAEIVKRIKNDVRKLPNVKMTKFNRLKGTFGFNRFSSKNHERNGLVLLLEELNILSLKSTHKFIPDKFFNVNNDVLSELFAGLWVTDGSISKREGNLSIGLSSEKMIDDIQHLLLKLDIIARKRNRITKCNSKEFESFELIISDYRSKLNFKNTIGKYLIGKKKKTLSLFWENIISNKENPNADTIPNQVWNQINTARLKAKTSWNSIRDNCIVASNRSRSVSRPKLNLIADHLQCEVLKSIANSDIYWDKIISIKYVGMEETFDLTMEGEPNFLANDIVVHNSYGYLVPAILYALKAGKPVIVSTGTHALQEQIIEKDVPFLEKCLPEFLATVAKGRNNYLCLKRFSEKWWHTKANITRAAGNQPLPDLSAAQKKLLESFPAESIDTSQFNVNSFKLSGHGQDSRKTNKELIDEKNTLVSLRQWSMNHPTGEKGSAGRTQFPKPALNFWDEINARADTCLNRKCGWFEECFLTKMRERAEEAEIIVVNHHLFFADFALRQKGFPGVLPDYAAVVFDEAHELPEIAADYFSFSFSSRRLAMLTSFVNKVLVEPNFIFLKNLLKMPEFERDMMILGSDLKSIISKVEMPVSNNSAFSGKEFLKVPLETGKARYVAEIDEIILNIQTVVSDRFKILKHQSFQEINFVKYSSEEKGIYDTMLIWFEEIVEELEKFLIRGDSQTFMYFAESGSNAGFKLEAVPYKAESFLKNSLFASEISSIMTSATISTQDGSSEHEPVANTKLNSINDLSLTLVKDKNKSKFKFLREELGIGEAFELFAESPFDYPNQMIYYFAPNLIPPAESQEFYAAALPHIESLIKISNGNCFVLSTSYAGMNYYYNNLKDKIPFPSFVQEKDVAKGELIDQFKNTKNSVLFATSSFWQGVDVAGDSLTCVIIDRLPFSVPTDAVNRAKYEEIEKAGRSSFFDYVLPKSIIALKQGIGRLIRTHTDYGVVAILDSRIYAKSYGKEIRKAIPHAKISYRLEEIQEFFNTHKR